MLDHIRRIGIVLLLAFVTAGCGAHRLKEAQDSFNQAAAIEAGSSLEQEQSGGDPLVGDPQAINNYRMALALTDEALDEHADSLAEDKLYGTALMLKALTSWRIAALDQDADTADVRTIVAQIEALAEEQEIVLGTRDRVLLKALPGLHEHALGLQESDPKKAGRLFESALSTLDQALKDGQPPEDHPVRVYIRLAQLRTVRAWRWVSYPDRPPNSKREELKNWNLDWNQRYRTYSDPLIPLMYSNPGLCTRVRNQDKKFGYQREFTSGDEKPECFRRSVP
jgi:hypothetical protein